MSKQVDRKEQKVAVAEFRYRHEAEMAAGFLEDAGIPFLMQTDDAGGAELGLSMLRPAVLWVRAVDAEVARELVAVGVDEPDPPATPRPQRPGAPPVGRLTVVERAVSGALAVALLAVGPNVPAGPLQGALVVLCFVGGFALLGAAAVGRAPAFLAGLIRTLSGSLPR